MGWSDHTLFERDRHAASLTSLLLGASTIERHFTVLKKTKTKDGPVSINFKEAKELAEYIKYDKKKILQILNDEYKKKWKLCIGKGNKPQSFELLNREYYRGRFAKFVRGKPNYNWQIEKL